MKNATSPILPVQHRTLVTLIRGLPQTTDALAWLAGFKELLTSLVDDVDRISLNMHWGLPSLPAPSDGTPVSVLTVISSESMERVAHTTESAGAVGHERLLINYRRVGLPVDDFHPPGCLDLYLPTGAYVGTLMLWRSKRLEPTSASSINLFKRLEPFLTYVLQAAIYRHRAAQPRVKSLTELTDIVQRGALLSDRQTEVLVHHLAGHDVIETARELGVSVATIQGHLKAAQRKIALKSSTRTLLGALVAALEARPNTRIVSSLESL